MLSLPHNHNPQPTPRFHPPSWFALVDSGASIHILLDTVFLTDSHTDHTAVASFSGSTSRATLKGSFTATVLTTAQKRILLLDRDSALVVPDATQTLYSIAQARLNGHHVHFGSSPGLAVHGNENSFVTFILDPHTNMYLLPLTPPPSHYNGTYPYANPSGPTANTSTTTAPNTGRSPPTRGSAFTQPSPTSSRGSAFTAPPSTRTPQLVETERQQHLTTHQRLGHISQRRMQQLTTGLPTSLKEKITCPTCIASRQHRANRPPPTAAHQRASQPWESVTVDLSGKMRILGVTNVSYYAPFVCDYSGAKIVEFINKKNDFIHAYRRFVTRIGHHPRRLHTDRGGEFMSVELKTLLELNTVLHYTCAPNEHYAIGPAENAVGRLRETALTLLVGANVPLRYWPFAISHSAYLSNYTSRSRADPHKTVYELLFNKQADLSRLPVFGCFCTIYQPRTKRQGGNLALPNIQGVFVGIGTYERTLGFLVINTQTQATHVTRQHLAFDTTLFPYKLKPTAPLLYNNFNNLTNPHAKGSITNTPHSPNADVEASDESDFDPEVINPSEPANDQTDIMQEDNLPTTPTTLTTPRKRKRDDVSSDSSDDDIVTTRSLRPRPLPASPTKVKPSNPKSEKFLTDMTYQTERLSHLNKRIKKHFAGHGTFHGTIKQYGIKTDSYHIVYDDGDDEVMKYKDVLTIIPGTPEYLNTQANYIALCVALDSAMLSAKTHQHATSASLSLEPNTYTDMRKSTDVSEWQKACDVEMTKLRALDCWTVIPVSQVPPGTPIMGSRWTFKLKTDAEGNTTRYRSRFVCQGFSQVKDFSYWESFSPVVSFTTIRTLLALTSLPFWLVFHYDVSVAFIQALIDKNDPPIYCRPAEGYESRKDFVYLLHRYLYGMKQAPRGYWQHFYDICTDWGMRRCLSDECVYIKTVSNDTRLSPSSSSPSLADLSSATPSLPAEYRRYPDCSYPIAVLIVSTYVDDNLLYTNSKLFSEEFAAHCNKSLTMTLEGALSWYLSVQYTRCPTTGRVTATQERYISTLLKQYGMESCKSLPVPFPAKADDLLTSLAIPNPKPDAVIIKQYQRLVGSLLYLQVHTCPEISYAISVLSRYMTSASDTHLALAKKVLRYLQSRKTLGISWCATECTRPHLPGEIYGWSDASFADVKSCDGSHRASSIGWLFSCNGGPISWRSTKTPLIALNVAESEIIALSSACQEAVFLRKLSLELLFPPPHSTIIYEDNESAVALSKENRFKKRSKHIDLRWSFVVEQQRRGNLRVVSVSRTIMVADILCSPRNAAAFIPFRNIMLGMSQRTALPALSDRVAPADEAEAHDVALPAKE